MQVLPRPETLGASTVFYLNVALTAVCVSVLGVGGCGCGCICICHLVNIYHDIHIYLYSYV